MATLTNAQIKTLVNKAYQQITGSEEVDEIDLSNFCDKGANSISDLREKFTKALLGVLTKTWFLDSSYRSKYDDPYFVDSERFGAITQMVSIEAPEVIDNSAWKDFTSGTTQVGTYTVYLPVVHSKFYEKTTSWALPITITGEQWDTAMKNEAELRTFVGYVFTAVDNAIIQHMKDMNYQNRNNFIAQKIAYAGSENATGIHVIDLIGSYVTDTGFSGNSFTVEDALNSKEFFAYASAKMKDMIEAFGEQTALFNTDGLVKFVPDDRLVFELLGQFERRMDSVLTANAFHDAYIALPNHRSVAWWQNPGDMSFEDVSSIHIKYGTGTNDKLERSAIVGLLADKWAIVHTIKSNRVASKYFDIENLTHYEYQHRDAYMNNLTQNAVVFVMNNYTKS